MIKKHQNPPVRRPEDATKAFLALAGTWQDERSAKTIAAAIRRTRHNSGKRFSPRHAHGCHG